MDGFIVVSVLWIFVSIMVGFVARSRGRNGVGWFFISILLTPGLATLLLLLVFPRLRTQQSSKSNDADLRKDISLGQGATRHSSAAHPDEER
jgi:hypothetical protein